MLGDEKMVHLAPFWPPSRRKIRLILLNKTNIPAPVAVSKSND